MELHVSCNASLDDSAPRDSALAFQLKLIGVGVIFLAGIVGVSLPIVGRGFRFLSTEGDVFFVSRAFAAGVILATGFVHILPDGVEALQNPCLPELWSLFPFGGCIAMLSALVTLVIDNLCTGYYEDLQSHLTHDGPNERRPLIRTSTSTMEKPEYQFLRAKSLLRLGSHAETIASVEKIASQDGTGQHVQEILRADEPSLSEREEAQIRNMVILQVLEVAIISHSFIIGLSLGLSGNPGSIGPLLAALSFHQFFEGFALGGSICQAAFECTSATVRAGLFAITTPLGIIVGIGAASSYNADTPKALIVEGFFDCASAGILIYMALVALIAPDFRCERLRGNRKLQLLSYLSLFGGTLSMSSLAIWA